MSCYLADVAHLMIVKGCVGLHVIATHARAPPAINLWPVTYLPVGELTGDRTELQASPW